MPYFVFETRAFVLRGSAKNGPFFFQNKLIPPIFFNSKEFLFHNNNFLMKKIWAN